MEEGEKQEEGENWEEKKKVEEDVEKKEGTGTRELSLQEDWKPEHIEEEKTEPIQKLGKNLCCVHCSVWFRHTIHACMCTHS